MLRWFPSIGQPAFILARLSGCVVVFQQNIYKQAEMRFVVQKPYLPGVNNDRVYQRACPQ